MADGIAVGFWLGLLAYLAPGAALTAWLFAGGLNRLDPLAAAAPLQVKFLIAPGLIALWPLTLRRLAGASAPEDRA